MVIIVGAGLVGSVLAIRLSQLGINVQLLEKNSYQKPSKKMDVRLRLPTVLKNS